MNAVTEIFFLNQKNPTTQVNLYILDSSTASTSAVNKSHHRLDPEMPIMPSLRILNKRTLR